MGAEAAAIVFYEEAISRGVVESTYNLGSVYFERGDDDEALVYFTRAARAGDIKGAFMAGQRYEELGDLESAERWFRSALAIDDTPFRHALVVRAQQRHAEADELVAENVERSWECAVDRAHALGAHDDSAIAMLERHFVAGVLEGGVTLASLLTDRGEEVR